MANYKLPTLGKISLFSKEASHLLSKSCLEASSCPWGTAEAPEATADSLGEEEEEGGGEVATREAKGDPTCLTCGLSFSSRQDQVEHYRLDWHRYNIKRRLKGLEGVDQGHFESLEGVASGG